MHIKMKNKIAFIGTILLNFLTLNSFAQDMQQPVVQSESSMSSVVLILVITVSVLVLLVLIYVLYALSVFIDSAKKTGAMKGAIALMPLTGAVPIERDHEIMLDHNYDGIRELDNNLPTWWVYMFYGTVIFAVFYMWYYHIYGTGNIQEEEYSKEMAQAEIDLKMFASKVDENSVVLLTDAVKIKNGETVFQSNCVACHGKKGEGGVGPNLTDDYWLHGGDIKAVFKSVKFGIPAKGMIPWQASLSPVQIQEVSSYILKIKGTNPPNPKAPQGDLVK